jgi:protein-disulfide isomerase
MLKRIVIMLAVSLFTVMGVSAQDTATDCSPGKISTALNGAYQKAMADLDSGISPQTVLANLQAKLTAVQAACADATAAAPDSTSFETGLDDYADIPQSRLDDGGFVLGDPHAPVTIVEFLDYGCPHCVNYQPTIRDFIRDYVRTGKAKFEARIFPTRGGETTVFTGNVIACLEEQKAGAFWAAQEILYEQADQGQYDELSASVVTGRLGLDYDKALRCSIDHTQVTSDVALANQFAVGSTPTIMVRYNGGDPKFITYQGTTYSGGSVPIEAIEAAINSTDGMNL